MSIEQVKHSARVLVVDDEPDLRTLYRLSLIRDGYVVDDAGTLHEAWELLSQWSYSVVITDMRLPDGLGIELLQRLRADRRRERCIVITAYGSTENAVDSLKAGAFDYLTKPVDLKQFRMVVGSAMQGVDSQHADLSADSDNGGARPPNLHAMDTPSMAQPHPALSSLVGRSAIMNQVRERIAKVAKSMAPVLIRGESGTGKELAAKALHAISHRRKGPLVAVNCSAIPDALLESEFFGSKKGAFTGAMHDRPGFFQSASGGTLFLDEIGDLPFAMQAKLLRAIQERSVRPVGSDREDFVDVRVISATHKDLARSIQLGQFRQDLYYRLNVIEICMPPLRERLEDLEELCTALASRIAAESGLPPPEISSQLLGQLRQEPLAGNVRELENLLHRAMAFSEGGRLTLQSAPDGQGTAWARTAAGEMDLYEPADASLLADGQTAQSDLRGDLQAHLDEVERGILLKTLQETRFNRTAAASKLGLSLRQIRYRMARLSIELGHEAQMSDGDGHGP
ncbi:MAG: hypothetical protein RLZZ126_1592 [Pseudomonadota bacterium]|jgi:two-component system, NtrC family, response regulator PilR